VKTHNGCRDLWKTPIYRSGGSADRRIFEKSGFLPKAATPIFRATGSTLHRMKNKKRGSRKAAALM
jgi:hypothetical protein